MSLGDETFIPKDPDLDRNMEPNKPRQASKWKLTPFEELSEELKDLLLEHYIQNQLIGAEIWVDQTYISLYVAVCLNGMQTAAIYSMVMIQKKQRLQFSTDLPVRRVPIE